MMRDDKELLEQRLKRNQALSKPAEVKFLKSNRLSTWNNVVMLQNAVPKSDRLK